MADVLLFIAVGFAAQLIDGAIGMAYGLFSTSVLLSIGISPAVASASVHAAEVFTTGASGLSHWRFGNINWSIVRRLAIPGMIGGSIGAYILSNVDGSVIRPIIGAYLALMGIWILMKAIRNRRIAEKSPRFVELLGLVGGFLDATGGGGWGPFVTSSMVGQGARPKTTIGSTSSAEFFVTLTISITFLTTIGLELWPIILGLIIGGVLAAPIAAYAVGRVPDRPMMLIVGTVICILTFREILRGFSIL
jgi:uncharacterized membrane protein YfcA